MKDESTGCGCGGSIGSSGGGENISCFDGENGSCFVGVNALFGGGEYACGGEVKSIGLFSRPKSTNSLSPSRSVMAETIWVLSTSCSISWL